MSTFPTPNLLFETNRVTCAAIYISPLDPGLCMCERYTSAEIGYRRSKAARDTSKAGGYGGRRRVSLSCGGGRSIRFLRHPRARCRNLQGGNGAESKISINSAESVGFGGQQHDNCKHAQEKKGGGNGPQDHRTLLYWGRRWQ
jgi:hypothetical protein